MRRMKKEGHMHLLLPHMFLALKDEEDEEKEDDVAHIHSTSLTLLPFLLLL